MSDDNTSNAKSSGAEIWIGAVGMLLAVLAFFGITNFEELARMVDGGIADKEACEMWSDADSELTRSAVGPGGSIRSGTYGEDIDLAAEKFDEAAEHADDDELSRILSGSADAYRAWANAMRSGEYSKRVNRIIIAANDSRSEIISICNPLLAGEEER
ncbi:hypothetical protein HNR23_002211 [Nocardiopsis mwathae]|uniref:Uncharacterized protein n=1 Tax=Nocardiopsis mwathae TaxID=1472723 RepID=A0A7W9YJ61_9ACTN|nr:hypothetical protein [Nocardiopsis mwathae]MBB6172151.1 hypothetical protein [Nocardiopsis mwathae]